MENLTPTESDLDPRRQARLLYWQGWRISRIAEQLALKAVTVHSWKRRDQWDDTDPFERVEIALEARQIQLIFKEKKEGRDMKELDLLGRQSERVARVRKYSNGGNEADLNPKVGNRNSGPRQKPQQNAISEEQQSLLENAFFDGLFDYQIAWHKAGLTERTRNLLKSRQIGATYYFAREALIDALQTGRNQIFLSASKAQAYQFKTYIQQFAREVADVELRGENIILPNGAKLIFLGTNKRTAQSYNGNLYIDEYFWIPGYKELRKVAAAMASQKRWRLTYFSTPSTLAHEAYPFWSGTSFNRGRAKADQVQLDISHEALAGGRRCEDGQWRQIVTIEDALAGGCDLFDLDQLKRENNPDELAQLFYCEFIDDGESIFPFAMMQKCLVDSWEVWEDYKPHAKRPLGYREVWIGYDPALTGDNAGCVILAPPAVNGGKFRIIERFQWKGMDFQAQADEIEAMTKRYNVSYIGIDTTGLGQAVFSIVAKFFPAARGFNYSPEVKARLVFKALDVISKGRLEFDSAQTEIAAAFMAIKKTTTASGRQVTYAAGRSEEASHADLAWATMHAMANEPLEGPTSTNGSMMEIYSNE